MSDDRQEPPAGNDADAARALPPDRDRAGTPTRPAPCRGTADPDARGRCRRPARPAVPRTARPGTHRPDRAGCRRAPLPPAWSGRAGVPPPRPAGYPEPGTEWYAEEQAGRRWWMPILLGILALLLIALIGVGVWLALRAARPGRHAVPVAHAAHRPAPRRPPPRRPRPRRAPAADHAADHQAAARVPMPPLVGLPEAAARAILDRLGVDYRVETRTSDRPAGTVIETDPAAGELISEGDQVTLVVAEAAAPTTGAGTPTPEPTATATATA